MAGPDQRIAAGRDRVIDIIESLEFDAAGRVGRVQAYFGPAIMADTTGSKTDA